MTKNNPLKPIKGWNSGDLGLKIETGQVERINPRSKSNSFNFTVPGQKAKSIHVSKLKVLNPQDSYTYIFSPHLSINVEENYV